MRPSLNGSWDESTGVSKVALAVGLVLGARWALRRVRRYRWQGKNAIVTGGSRGLGLEIARVLVRRGARVAIVARDPAEIERALEDLRRRDPSCDVVGVPCDLTADGAVEAMLARVRRNLGPIDVLINNAGTIQVGPLDAMTMRDFEAAMALHWQAPLRAMLGVRDEMRARGGGRIANIASVGGLLSVPHLLPYSTSKFALVGLSEGMHAALSRDGIVVSTIAPGLMRTGSPRQASFKGDSEKEHAWFAVADSLPFLSMSSARAARRIVSAIEHGEAHVVLGLPAQIGALAHGLVPGLVSQAMSLVNSLLPSGNDPRAKLGYQSRSAVSPSLLTRASDEAARRNNE
jgi:short-subunit dehydrogenase